MYKKQVESKDYSESSKETMKTKKISSNQIGKNPKVKKYMINDLGVSAALKFQSIMDRYSVSIVLISSFKLKLRAA